MLVCVTGGTGFLGSYLVRALLEDGHQVRVLHRKSSKLSALEGLDYESVIGDIGDSDSLFKAFQDCDWVFHVAAIADYWRADKAQMFEVNVEGTRNVLSTAQRATVKRVVYTSSAAAIGILPDGTPSNESVPFNVPPEHFAYAYSKALAEQVVQEFVAEGLDAVIVNPAVVIGPGDLNMISGSFITQTAQLQWLIPKSSGGMGVIDIRDVAQGHLAAVKQGQTGARYILSTENLSYADFFGMIAEVVGVSPPIFPMPDFLIPISATIIGGLGRLGIALPINADQTRLGRRKVYFDTTKMHTELYRAQIPIRQSIEETYRWYQQKGYLKETWFTKTLKTIGGLWQRA